MCAYRHHPALINLCKWVKLLDQREGSSPLGCVFSVSPVAFQAFLNGGVRRDRSQEQRWSIKKKLE